jgi:hypothetical protein
MWLCTLCNKEFEDDILAVELRLGYVDEEEIKEGKLPYDAFYPRSGVAPICDDCAIAYLKGKGC